jgi:hypothetical protein
MENKVFTAKAYGATSATSPFAAIKRRDVGPTMYS